MKDERTPEERRYASTMPEDALARNAEREATRHSCCWEPRDGSHHPLCAKFEPEQSVDPIAGQESLL